MHVDYRLTRVLNALADFSHPIQSSYIEKRNKIVLTKINNSKILAAELPFFQLLNGSIWSNIEDNK